VTDPLKTPILPSQNALTVLSQIVAARQDVSRSDLMDISGHSRVTIGQRLTELFDAGVIIEAEKTKASGGRPTRPIRLNQAAGLIAAADLGETHIHFGITDLNTSLLSDATVEFDIHQPPEDTLNTIAIGIQDILKKLDRSLSELVGIGLSLPAPVNFNAGTVEGPSVMAGWDDFNIRGYLQKHLPVPVMVDNDVNLLAMSEVAGHSNQSVQMIFVKVGTGIGCGIIADQRVFRGANGAAGDIGHIQFSMDPAQLCRCGKLGCVEAMAGGWAIARDLRSLGFEARTARDVADMVRNNVPEAIQLVRKAGRVLGEVVADIVSVLNPDSIVFGGMLAETGEHLLSGVREIVYQRCLPLATRNLNLSIARHDPVAGLRGSALLVRQTAFSTTHVSQTVASLMQPDKTNGAKTAS